MARKGLALALECIIVIRLFAFLMRLLMPLDQ